MIKTAKGATHAVVVSLLCTFLQSGCDKSESTIRTQEGAKETVKQKTIEEVLAAYTPEWMAVPGVIGTGVGECADKPCIVVMVLQVTDSLSRRIPRKVEGFPVRIEETGEIKAH